MSRPFGSLSPMFCRFRQSRGRMPRRIERMALALAACFAATGSGAPVFARSLADMLDAKRLNICVQEDNAPFSMDGAKPRGVFIDLGDAIAKRLGVKANYIWLFSAEYVRKTDCDLIPAVADIPGDDPIRRTVPYLSVRSVLVIKKDRPPVEDLEALRGGHIAVLATSWARHVLNEAGYQLWVRFLTNDEILDAVAKGDADGGVVPLPAYQWRMHTDAGTPLRVEENIKLDPSFNYQVSMGLRRVDAATVGRFDEILRQLMEDGAMEKIFAGYGLSYERPADDSQPFPDTAAKNGDH